MFKYYFYLLYCLQYWYRFNVASVLTTPFSHTHFPIPHWTTDHVNIEEIPINGDCKNGVCPCSSTYPVYSNGKCNLGWGFYEECNPENNKCPFKIIHGECVENTCKCPLNKLVFSDGKCIAVQHEKCSYINNSCENNRICINNSCQCKPGTVDLGTSCIEGVSIGKPCINEIQCRIYDHLSHCINGTCLCPNNCTLPGNICVKNCLVEDKAVEVGGVCHTDWQCQSKTEKSICSDGICICPYNSFLYHNKCLDAIQYGKACDETIQCHQSIYLSECINKICSCPPHLPKVNKIILSCQQVDKSLGNNTTSSWLLCSECKWPNYCMDGICKCHENYPVKDGNSCYKPASFGYPCEVSSQCSYSVGFSTCHLATCQCLDYYVYTIGGICVQSKLYGEYCNWNAECQNFGGICKYGRCFCEDSYTYINRYCVLGTTIQTRASYGEYCDTNDDCWNHNGICQLRCFCDKGYLLENGYCVYMSSPQPLTASYGEHCNTNSDCWNHNGICQHSKCFCDKIYSFKNGYCVYVTSPQPLTESIYRRTCYYSFDCDDLPNTVCKKSHCECLVGYTFKNGVCISPSSIRSEGFYLNLNNLLIGVCTVIALIGIMILICFIARCRRQASRRMPRTASITANLLQDFHQSVYQLENPPTYEELYPNNNIPSQSTLTLGAIFIQRTRNSQDQISTLNPPINDQITPSEVPTYTGGNHLGNCNYMMIETNSGGAATLPPEQINTQVNLAELIGMENININKNTQVEEQISEEANKRY